MARKKHSYSETPADQKPERVSRSEKFGQWSEAIARAMGTPGFLVFLTMFCVLWILWNTLAPEAWRFDSAAIGFTALTLILSLQASYAAPMILLAQNRQDDRDRVQIEQDRQRAERNLADTEFLAREVVALRLALKDLPDRDWVRHELRDLLEELNQQQAETAAAATAATAVSAASAAATPATAATPAASAAPAQPANGEATPQQGNESAPRQGSEPTPRQPLTGSEIEVNPLTGRLDIVKPQ